MPERPLQPGIPTQHATGRTGHQHGTRRESQTSKNWQDQQTR